LDTSEPNTPTPRRIRKRRRYDDIVQGTEYDEVDERGAGETSQNIFEPEPSAPEILPGQFNFTISITYVML